MQQVSSWAPTYDGELDGGNRMAAGCSKGVPCLGGVLVARAALVAGAVVARMQGVTGSARGRVRPPAAAAVLL